MSFFARLGFFVAVTVASALPRAFAQTTETKPADKPAAEKPTDPAKDAQRQVDEFAEATRLVNGPAGNPECVWLGRRVVGLMWRDDMDTAFRHLDLYDRFGCPGPHIQSSFRCVVRQGNNIDPKSPQSLNARVHSCWLNPTAASQSTAAAPAGPAAAAATPTGTAPVAAPPAGAAPPPPTAQISGPNQATIGTPNKEAR